MNSSEIFTKKQLNRLNKIKNPTVTKIIELSDELEMDLELIAKFYLERNSKNMNTESLDKK